MLKSFRYMTGYPPGLEPDRILTLRISVARVSILQVVVRQSMRMVLIGVVTGLPSAAGFTRLMSNMLYGVAPGDATIFFLLAAIITFTALLPVWDPRFALLRLIPSSP